MNLISCIGAPATVPLESKSNCHLFPGEWRPMSALGSVTDLLDRIKAGDEEAARLLWERYAPRLLGLIIKRLAGQGPGLVDPEEVVLSVLGSFFLGARGGQFTRLQNRSDLWNLLAAIARNKVADLVKREQRRPACSVDDLSEIADPRLATEFHQLLRELLDRLGDAQLRSIAVWKLEGYTNAEIATFLGCVERTVERKLRFIRETWTEESES